MPPKTTKEKILAMPKGETMLRIAIAESELVPTAKNPHSSAKGLFQIIDGTWRAFDCEGDVLDPDDNIACAVKIAENGLHHWNASKSKWDLI